MSEDITLRELRPEDVGQAYVDWLNDPRVNQYLESRFVTHTLEGVRAYVDGMYRDPNQRMFGIYEGDTHIGNIKLGNIDRWHSRCDIGLLIAPGAWGRGVATRAIALAERAAFDEEGLHKVFAGVYAPNEASLKAFLRNGWRLAGTWTEHERVEDGFCDCYLVEKVRSGPSGLSSPAARSSKP